MLDAASTVDECEYQCCKVKAPLLISNHSVSSLGVQQYKKKISSVKVKIVQVLFGHFSV